MDGYVALQRYQHGEDMRPHLRSVQQANMVHVFTMYGPDLGNRSGYGPLVPSEVPDFYPRTTDYLKLAADEGKYVELIGVADYQLLRDRVNADDHLRRLYDAIDASQVATAFLIFGNEIFKNGVSREDLRRWLTFPRPSNVLVATGDYDVPWDGGESIVIGDYVGWHNDGTVDPSMSQLGFAKEPRAALDIRDGAKEWHGCHCPVRIDEMHPRAISQAAMPEAYRAFGGVMSLFCDGTIHTDSLMEARPLDPAEKPCVDAFFQGLGFAPLEAQLAGYIRGGAHNQNIGDLGIVHHDLIEYDEHNQPIFPPEEPRCNRTYAKIVVIDGIAFQFVVACDPSEQWAPLSQNGWQIVSEPWRGAVILRR